MALEIQKGEGKIFHNGKWIRVGELGRSFQDAMFIVRQREDGKISDKLARQMIAQINVDGILDFKRKK